MVASLVPLRRFSTILKGDQIQYPPEGPFCSSHLKWTSECAWIPLHRLEDFIEGEENRHGCNTIYKTTKTEEYHDKVSGEGLRSKERYHCTYGPEDERFNVQKSLPDARKFDNGKKPLRYTTQTRFSVKRGCTAHFYITRYENRPDAVQITWLSRDHVDKSGNPCHGFADKSAEFCNAHVAPRLSRRTITFIERLIQTGVKTSEIILAHCKNLRNHWRAWYPDDQDKNFRWSRDMMLTPRDVKTIWQYLLRKKVDYNTADHLAVHTWVQNNDDQVFLYQEKTNSTPFILGWASEWQISKAATLGHKRTVAMDATFGTNFFDFSLFTVLAYDEHHNGIPVAWALMERSKSPDLVLFLAALKTRVEEYMKDKMMPPEWKPLCFMIDVAS